jgi:hypothetical protein
MYVRGESLASDRDATIRREPMVNLLALALLVAGAPPMGTPIIPVASARTKAVA